MSGVLGNRIYDDNIKTSGSPIIILARSVNKSKKITRDHYVQRCRILIGIPIFKNAVQYAKNIIRLDVACNAAHLAQYLFEREPSYTVKIDCSCGFKIQQEYTFISLNVDILMCQGLKNIEKAS